MKLLVRTLGLQPYLPIWETMQRFTQEREEETTDELWLLEHSPVYTLGQAGKEEHILRRSDTVPILKIDRGGQVTYHGPGQLMAYTLVDLRRKNLSVHQLVHGLENSVIRLLAHYDIQASSEPKAPGVYVEGKKICSVGLRIRRGCAYHGLAFNVNMDLSPFNNINPCGYQGLSMTQLADFIPSITLADILPLFTEQFCQELRYNNQLSS